MHIWAICKFELRELGEDMPFTNVPSEMYGNDIWGKPIFRKSWAITQTVGLNRKEGAAFCMHKQSILKTWPFVGFSLLRFRYIGRARNASSNGWLCDLEIITARSPFRAKGLSWLLNRTATCRIFKARISLRILPSPRNGRKSHGAGNFKRAPERWNGLGIQKCWFKEWIRMESLSRSQIVAKICDLGSDRKRKIHLRNHERKPARIRSDSAIDCVTMKSLIAGCTFGSRYYVFFSGRVPAFLGRSTFWNPTWCWAFAELRAAFSMIAPRSNARSDFWAHGCVDFPPSFFSVFISMLFPDSFFFVNLFFASVSSFHSGPLLHCYVSCFCYPVQRFLSHLSHVDSLLAGSDSQLDCATFLVYWYCVV